MTIKKEDKGFRVWARNYDIYGHAFLNETAKCWKVIILQRGQYGGLTDY
jgi:predicted secreted protein